VWDIWFKLIINMVDSGINFSEESQIDTTQTQCFSFSIESRVAAYKSIIS
jgi:hypothetical protein